MGGSHGECRHTSFSVGAAKQAGVTVEKVRQYPISHLLHV